MCVHHRRGWKYQEIHNIHEAPEYLDICETKLYEALNIRMHQIDIST